MLTQDEKLNPVSLDTLCAALCRALGVHAPDTAAAPNQELLSYLQGRTADRIFMYNPDAVAQWIYRKYPQLFKEAVNICDVEIPMQTVMPSVTPVCFGTMYTGAQPAVHGIQKYEKPVIRIQSIFDMLIAAGKKCAIVADTECSMSHIFNDRKMDYYFYNGYLQATAKAFELIKEDQYDMIVLYNGNYDSIMHKTGPESLEALSEARANTECFASLYYAIKENWKNHNTLLGFAMDHGCHEIDGNCGSHGLDMPEDLNICHLYKYIEREAQEQTK